MHHAGSNPEYSSTIHTLQHDIAQTVLAVVEGAAETHRIYSKLTRNLSGLQILHSSGAEVTNAAGDLVRLIDIESEKAILNVALSLYCAGSFVGEEIGHCELSGAQPARSFYTDGIDGTLAYRLHTALTELSRGNAEPLFTGSILPESMKDLTKYLREVDQFPEELAGEEIDPAFLLDRKPLLAELTGRFSGFGNLFAVYEGSTPRFDDYLVSTFTVHARQRMYLAVRNAGAYEIDLSRKEAAAAVDLLRSARPITAALASSVIHADVLYPGVKAAFPGLGAANTVAVSGMMLDVILNGSAYVELTRSPKKQDLELATLYGFIKEAGGSVMDLSDGRSVGPEIISGRGSPASGGVRRGTCVLVHSSQLAPIMTAFRAGYGILQS